MAQKNKVWLFFSAVILTAIQFFWVLAKYQTIESGKVFWWTIFYALPISIISSLYFNNRFTEILFYSYTKRYNRNSISRINHFKNQLTSQALITLVFCFCFYGTIIQTNDWFSSKEYHYFNEEVLSVEMVQHARARKSIGGGNVTYNIGFIFKGETITISCKRPYQIGDRFAKTLNVGGLWGVLFEE